MVFLDYDPVGKTLHEIYMACRNSGWGTHGVSVWVLGPDDPDNGPGTHVAEEFTLGAILKAHPELPAATCVRYNDFCGETVLRVVMPEARTVEPDAEDPGQAAMEVKADNTCHGTVRLKVSMETEVQLTGNDVFNWLTHCTDVAVLTHLGNYALKCARELQDPDTDDFRGRA